jgi:dienelactone hydrolase
MRFASLLVSVALFVTPVVAGGLDGSWKGTWTKNGDSIPVIMRFQMTPDHLEGSFDSDALQVAKIPFAEVDVNGDHVNFLLKGDNSTTTFHGRFAGDALSGSFTEGSTQGTFDFTRSAFPSDALSQRDVQFRDGAVTLAGTLLAPHGGQRHPAILFLQGSGPEGRWANRYLAQKFAEAGFVALIYDKRGVGQSTGDWKTAGFDVLADDGAAGVRFLQAQPDVDATRVGIYGHSQGGTLAPLVADKISNLNFIIASAASGISPADTEIFSVGNSIGITDLKPSERGDAESYVRELVHVAYDGADRAPLDQMAARFKSRDWYFDPPPPDNSYWAISRAIARYVPSEAWQKTTARALLVYGDHDARSPAQPSIAAIQAALAHAGRKPATVRIYPGADHIFMLVGSSPKDGWPRRVPGYAYDLIAWAKAQ